jgi:hypothetical protein
MICERMQLANGQHVVHVSSVDRTRTVWTWSYCCTGQRLVWSVLRHLVLLICVQFSDTCFGCRRSSHDAVGLHVEQLDYLQGQYLNWYLRSTSW